MELIIGTKYPIENIDYIEFMLNDGTTIIASPASSWRDKIRVENKKGKGWKIYSAFCMVPDELFDFHNDLPMETNIRRIIRVASMQCYDGKNERLDFMPVCALAIVDGVEIPIQI